MKSRNANGASPPVADNGAGISGSDPQDAAQQLSSIPSKAGQAHPSALASEEDRQHDYSLRPRSLAEFVGQERIRKVLAMSIEAARQRGEPLDHVLFSAPPGLGKTSLAHIIARELGVNLRVTSGPAIERAGDLAADPPAAVVARAGVQPPAAADSAAAVAADAAAATDSAAAAAVPAVPVAAVAADAAAATDSAVPAAVPVAAVAADPAAATDSAVPAPGPAVPVAAVAAKRAATAGSAVPAR